MRRSSKLGLLLALLLAATNCGTSSSGTGADDAATTTDAGGDGGASEACTDGETKSCYSGPAGTAGVARCVAGIKTCDHGVFGACVGEITPAVETCDGIDDDCDGTPDNGAAGAGKPCSTNLLGVCAAGTTTCVSGAIVCKQNVASSAEICDGLDNDCDGAPDNGNPGAGQPCSTSLLGACASGTSACVSGATVCNQNVASSAETCDTVDNDCDGTPDDGTCGTGVALSFDGANDRVDAPVPALFNDLGTSDFTIEAWVYPTTAVFSRIVFAQGSTTNFAALSQNTTGQLYFYVVDNGTNVSIATTGNVLPLNQWTHVAGTYVTATNTPTIFINGAVSASTGGGASSTGTNGMLTIGSRTNGAQYFTGMIDEVRIWNVARSACLLDASFACESPLTEVGLIATYDFDQGTPGGNNAAQTQLLDRTAAANHGTLSGFALTGSTSNWVAAGGGVGAGITGHVCGPSGC